MSTNNPKLTKKNICGDNIRCLRVIKRISQQDLSDKLGALGVVMCRGSISRVEKGTRIIMDIELYGISIALDTNVDALFP